MTCVIMNVLLKPTRHEEVKNACLMFIIVLYVLLQSVMHSINKSIIIIMIIL